MVAANKCCEEEGSRRGLWGEECYIDRVLRNLFSEGMAFGQRQRSERGGLRKCLERRHQAEGRASAKADASLLGALEEDKEAGRWGRWLHP